MAESRGSILDISGRAFRLLWRKQRQPQRPDNGNGVIKLCGSDSADIDICFVHGLSGDRVRTWESAAQNSEETHTWPSDFLAQDVEADHIKARILSYGYKSFAPTSEYLAQRTLYRHSQQLLSALAEVRRGHHDRPLIFVGHSVGGIVIKSALIFSSQAKAPDLLALSVSTTGIVFLGTPHTEAMSSLDQSKWPKMLANIVELTRVGDPSLVKHLDRQSLSLQNRLQPFKALSNNISIVSYYEGIPSPIKGVLVPKPSTGSPYGDRVDIIYADHRNMCKFSSRDDDGYRRVSREILRLCNEASDRLRQNWEKQDRSKGEEADSMNYMKRVRSTETTEQTPRNVGQEDFRIEVSISKPRNEKFVGRVEELEFLRKTLLKKSSTARPVSDKCATVNLHGPGGMGKTEIAREFAHAHKDRFTSVFWIPGASRQSIEQGLVKIARILRGHSVAARRILPDLPSDAELGEGQLRLTISAVIEWFQSKENPNWLVVVDDLELAGDHDIMKLIPRTASVHGHCIITSREPVDWSFVTKCSVGPFSRDESYSLLRASTGFSDASDRDLARLSGSLNYIPMALSAAASYISSTQMTLHNYMQLFQRRSNTEEEKLAIPLKNELTRIENLLSNTIKNVPTTNRLHQPLSLRIFQVCCVLSMESVCVSIFSSKSFRESCPGSTMTAIKELERNKLVALTEDERYLITQNEVLEHCYCLFSDQQRRYASQLACESTLSVAISLKELRDEDRTYETPFAERDLAAVISSCYQLIKGNIPGSDEWHIDLDIMGQICERQGRTSDAVDFYNLLVERNKGAALALRKTKMRLALTRRTSGDNVRAEALCEELIQPKNSVLLESTTPASQQPLSDEVDIEALRLLKKMAHEKYNPEEELAISKQIAAVQEYRLGHMDPGTLEAVQELAKDLVEVGFYDEAEANMRRVVLSYENLVDASYVKKTEAYEVLASIRLKQGKYDDAKDLFDRALHNHLARLGRDHPTTQKCWSQLGQVYDMQNKYGIAGQVYDKCLTVLNATLGADHPDVLRVRSYKATNLSNRGLYVEAEDELKDVLSRMEVCKDLHHENDMRRTALQLVEILKKNPRAEETGWLAENVQDLELKYDIDLHHRIGWIY
ncbi:hypothetical protein F5Y06DRAFT_274287 [Hypoxylon sp. FL0890]|nr:hypothetical protein F5Y06DRAFT_274287 [Hypoxylon sp. FL0890]